MNRLSLNRRHFLKTAGAAAVSTGVLGAAAPLAAQGPGRPNILTITCHDLGRHLNCYGVKTVHSDNLDALAARGVRFQNYFAGAPTCSPSRGVMLTGRYPQSNGLMGLTHAPWWWKLNEGERHLAAILKDAGYATTLIGLQHVTQADPRTLGYENVLSPQSKAEESVAAAKTFLRDAKPGGKPFFCKVGFMEVHRAGGDFKHREPDTSKGLYVPPYLQPTAEIKDDLARFQMDIRVTDGYIGEILDALKDSAVAPNTLVIFTADHGIPYAGAKWSLREAGLQIPLIMHLPGSPLTGGKVHEQLMGNVDFLPTLLDLVGAPIPKNVQGVSFKSVIEGRTGAAPRQYVYAQRVSHALRDNTGRCIRDKRYKLIRTFEQGREVIFPTDAHPGDVSRHTARPKRKGGHRPFALLYDLESDPHELKNISGDPKYKEVIAELSRALYAWMKLVDDPILKGPIATPYYQRAMEEFNKFQPK